MVGIENKKTYEEFLEQSEEFERDFELSQKRLKLLVEWESKLPWDEFETLSLGNFELSKPTVEEKDEVIQNVKIKEHKLTKRRSNNKNLF